jgi:hypothetical protein
MRVRRCGGQDARRSNQNQLQATNFRGVCTQRGGKFGARIADSMGKAQRWLGSYNTRKEAARAYDAAAVKRDGAAARTNFQQPAAVDDGISSLLAEPSGRSLKGNVALCLGGSTDNPSMRHDDLLVHVSLATLLCIACLVTVCVVVLI